MVVKYSSKITFKFVKWFDKSVYFLDFVVSTKMVNAKTYAKTTFRRIYIVTVWYALHTRNYDNRVVHAFHATVVTVHAVHTQSNSQHAVIG